MSFAEIKMTIDNLTTPPDFFLTKQWKWCGKCWKTVPAGTTSTNCQASRCWRGPGNSSQPCRVHGHLPAMATPGHATVWLRHGLHILHHNLRSCHPRKLLVSCPRVRASWFGDEVCYLHSYLCFEDYFLFCFCYAGCYKAFTVTIAFENFGTIFSTANTSNYLLIKNLAHRGHMSLAHLIT